MRYRTSTRVLLCLLCLLCLLAALAIAVPAFSGAQNEASAAEKVQPAKADAQDKPADRP